MDVLGKGIQLVQEQLSQILQFHKGIEFLPQIQML